jgi:hypothetical protein
VGFKMPDCMHIYSLGNLVTVPSSEVLHWSFLFGVWSVRCTWVSISSPRFGKISPTISLSILSMPSVYISAPSFHLMNSQIWSLNRVP